MSYTRFQQQLLDIENRIEGGFSLKSKRLGKTGDQFELLGIEGRNNGITLKRKEKQRIEAKRSHSYIPGQCKNEEMRGRPFR